MRATKAELREQANKSLEEAAKLFDLDAEWCDRERRKDGVSDSKIKDLNSLLRAAQETASRIRRLKGGD